MILNYAWPLLAQVERFDNLRDRFSGPRARFGWEDALTAVFVVLVISVALYFINRWHSRYSGRRSYNSSRALFRELCKIHRLDRSTRKLLKRVARWQRLKQPSRLFLEPERYEPANLSAELQRYSAELFELRSRLFTFEVEPESRDSMTASLTHEEESTATEEAPAVSEAEQKGAQEAVGAAAFSGTRLEELHDK